MSCRHKIIITEKQPYFFFTCVHMHAYLQIYTCAACQMLEFASSKSSVNAYVCMHPHAHIHTHIHTHIYICNLPNVDIWIVEELGQSLTIPFRLWTGLLHARLRRRSPSRQLQYFILEKERRQKTDRRHDLALFSQDDPYSAKKINDDRKRDRDTGISTCMSAAEKFDGGIRHAPAVQQQQENMPASPIKKKTSCL